MAFTMACPNFKKGLKMVFGPLGVNAYATSIHPVLCHQSTLIKFYHSPNLE
jgi:hypothetical protein